MYDNAILVVLSVSIVIIYMLPTFVAYGRDIPQREVVTIVNIVLGWTLIGWMVVFLWAMLAEPEVEEVS